MALSIGLPGAPFPSSRSFSRKHLKSNMGTKWENHGYHSCLCTHINVNSVLYVRRPLLSQVGPSKRQSQHVYSTTSVGEPSHDLGSDEKLVDSVQEEEPRKTMSDPVEEDILRGNTVEKAEGKPGFVTFNGMTYFKEEEKVSIGLNRKPSNFFWFVGPTILVASFLLPSLYMRKIILLLFEDSLLTDFLILFITEALFYGGVAAFVLLIDLAWNPLQLTVPNASYRPRSHFGLRISSVATLVLSLIIPSVTMGMVWPWTGPAASATLAPYLVGLVVQFAFEQYARRQKSSAWPVIPVIFQVYRLHQLNRAAQLVTALSYSVRGAETTPQTIAINKSLGTLLNVLHLLGVICIWSLSSFLMRFFPSSPVNPDP